MDAAACDVATVNVTEVVCYALVRMRPVGASGNVFVCVSVETAIAAHD